MTYEPLHHKYRPQRFKDLVGQEAIATTLIEAIRQQRIAPAYLFCGPRGTGKTSSARIFAKSLNCMAQAQPTEEPCGVCETCRAIALGNALDVIEIDAASNTGVDNIRELIEKAQFAPVQCRYKVYVIDECHMLSTAAFNALLKTLEEPPARVVFVLATTDPQRVLPTIISRCQRFDYRRIPLDSMVQHLRYIAATEQIQLAEDAITLVAQIAQGGLRDAESLLDQLSLLPPPVEVDAVWDLVGAVPERDLFSLVEAIAAQNPEAIVERARHLMNRGREPLIVLQNLASFYRDMLIAKTAPQRSDLVAMTPTTWKQLCQFVQGLEMGIILQGQQHLRSSEVQLKNTSQPRLWLEVTLMGLLSSSPLRSLAEPITPTHAVHTPPVPGLPTPLPTASLPTASLPTASLPTASLSTASLPTAPSQIPTSDLRLPTSNGSPPPSQIPTSDLQPPSPPPTPSEDLPSLWQRVATSIESRSTQTLLRQMCQLLSLQGNQVKVGTTQPWLKKIQEQQPLLETTFSRVLNRSIKVQIEVVSAFQPGVAANPKTPTIAPSTTSSTIPSTAPPPANPPSPPKPPAPPNPLPAQIAPNLTSSLPSSLPSSLTPGLTSPLPANPPPSPSTPLPAPPSSNRLPSPTEKSPTPLTITAPPPPAHPRPDWYEDEVTQAAKSLANFFNGELVKDEEIGEDPTTLGALDIPDAEGDGGSDAESSTEHDTTGNTTSDMTSDTTSPPEVHAAVNPPPEPATVPAFSPSPEVTAGSTLDLNPEFPLSAALDPRLQALLALGESTTSEDEDVPF